MKIPHQVATQATTKCVIGPNQRLIYGGEKIVQKFIYSKDDVEQLDYKYIERIKRDTHGLEVEFTYQFPDNSADPYPAGTVFNILLPVE